MMLIESGCPTLSQKGEPDLWNSVSDSVLLLVTECNNFAYQRLRQTRCHRCCRPPLTVSDSSDGLLPRRRESSSASEQEVSRLNTQIVFNTQQEDRCVDSNFEMTGQSSPEGTSVSTPLSSATFRKIYKTKTTFPVRIRGKYNVCVENKIKMNKKHDLILIKPAQTNMKLKTFTVFVSSNSHV